MRKGLPHKTRRGLILLGLVLSLLVGLWLGMHMPGLIDALAGGDIEPSQPLSETQSEAAREDHAPFPGRWTARMSIPADVDRETMEQIIALGYMAGTSPATPYRGVTHYDEEKAFDGLNLYCSGHAQKAYLMDMRGNVLHTWEASYEDIGPGDVKYRGKDFWRRVYLGHDGSLLAVYEFVGLVKLDNDSHVLWTNWSGCHHDMHVEQDEIHVLGRELKIVPWFSPEKEVYDDFILTLDHDGNELNRVSLLESLQNSKYRRTLSTVRDKLDITPDVLHTNTVEILDGRLGDGEFPFVPGHALVSMLGIDSIGVVDLAQKEFTWFMGMGSLWRWQHEPKSLDNGNMLIFANYGLHFPEIESSQILELDPYTHEIKWVYEGDPPEEFFTATCGAVQRLPNGNTLITESDKGRAFEVTPGGEIVWEFYNPAQIDGGDSVLVATLFEVVRLPPDFPLTWLDEPADPL